MMTIEIPVAARVVVAEDDAIVAEDLREALGELGYEVPAVVGSGEDAIRAARIHQPDLILMDVRMPGRLDGIQAAGRISEEMNLPVVFLSAYSDDQTLGRAKETHPFGYLVKPFEPRELKTAIEIAMYRHHAEHLISESRERYRRLFEDDIAAHYISTPEGKILDANRAFAELLGAETVDEVLDRHAAALYVSEAARVEFLRELRERGEVRGRRGTMRRIDGEPVPVLENARGIFDDEGRLRKIHGNLIDMSRERKLEERLRRSARMEAVGRLAGGIAHDFNNLLLSVRGTVDLVVSEESLSEEARSDLETVLETCDRAAGLVRGLLATGGRSGGEPRDPVSLSRLVEETRAVLSGLMGPGQELDVSVGEAPHLVEGVESQLEQVVLNLVLNARDAVPEGGRVQLTLRESDDLDDPASEGEARSSTGWIVLTVSDDGSGMDEETRERIFDPFYTTKEEGTGLGLAAVYGIVRDHGGEIVVESEPGRGTEFRVCLPRAEPG